MSRILRKFPSFKEPQKYGYAFDSDAWDSRAQVCWYFRMFETYGHVVQGSVVQHSSDWGITREYMTDYLASLAAAMLADEELVERAAWQFASPRVESIEFAASVVFKPSYDGSCYEKKTRFVSMSEKKISSSPEKDHDKRYRRVESWMDGGAMSIYRLLAPEMPNAMECFGYAEAIREWIFSTKQQNGNLYMPLTGIFLEWFENTHEGQQQSRDLAYSYEACRHLIQAYQHKQSAQTCLNNVSKPKPENAETQESAA